MTPRVISAFCPKKIRTEGFKDVRIGGFDVHSEVYGSRFASGRKIKVQEIEAVLGKVIAQGEDNDGDGYRRPCFWTKDWVAVIDNNHGTESLYCLPRNPSTPRPHDHHERAKVFLVYDMPLKERMGDFIADGYGGWCAIGATIGELVNGGEFYQILWSEKYVYAEEMEYEGEIVLLRAFPRNP